MLGSVAELPALLDETAGADPHPEGRAVSGGSGIRFDRVSVGYDGTTVLELLDLAVEPGEVMALLGPSRSGTTTALRAVAGCVRPASGRVFIGDRDMTALPPHRRGVGMVVQRYALLPHMRVEDNVAFGLGAEGRQGREAPERVTKALEMTGMAAYAGAARGDCPAGSSRVYPRPLKHLGEGRHRAGARHPAGVLLLDEPLCSGLDRAAAVGNAGRTLRLHRELRYDKKELKQAPTTWEELLGARYKNSPWTGRSSLDVAGPDQAHGRRRPCRAGLGRHRQEPRPSYVEDWKTATGS